MPKLRFWILTSAALLGGGCASSTPLDPGAGDAGAAALDVGGGASTGADAGGPGDAAAPEADGGVARVDASVLSPLPAAVATDLGRFTTAEACALCHSNHVEADAMRDDQDRPIAPYDLWASSMKANAVRDPFFRAVLSAELAETPAARAAIEAKCFTCHAPMGRTDAVDQGAHLALADVYAGTPRGQLALDGVSCTACHQIQPTGLGTEESFSGGYVINQTRSIYGPHEGLFSMPMVMHTNYTPEAAPHMTDSALCGSCHTLFTHALDADANPTGETLPEQTPYLEWRNSAFNTEGGAEGQSCQSCHMPTVDVDGQLVRTAIARNPNGVDFGRVGARAPYGRHVLVGGNTLVPAMLRDHADELSPTASARAFDATIARATEQLTQRTARVAVGPAVTTGAGREVPVQVTNLTGHKLPTGYPSRRVWLWLEARDAAGQVVLQSGAFDARGRILGPDGAPLPSELAGGPSQAHTDRVDGAGQPAIWQSVMGRGDGAATFTLLRGARYLEDNRILPRGWRPDHADAASTAPVGVQGDPSFSDGQDTVTVALPASAATLEVRLVYQVISARWVAELATHDTPEVAAFLRYWAAADVAPVVLAAAQAAL